MRLPALLTLATFLAAIPTWAQQKHVANSSVHQKTAQKRLNISGKVSDDGETFTADTDGTIWQVVNSDVLRGIHGRHITIRAFVNPTKNELEILTVRAFDNEHANAKLDDAAFRR